ncbi:hypothetical protein E1301_Tti005104 [Triplophysa tibetana]|uniref:Rho-GAP domain-containing protein n=1 Tax=Triplophysa tibetana TaxID=1572043 RepID=A0A5A9NX64_9TELE|nr:hypothetical protein E1301_Tti005104 [Triplophysa tibetana]
MHAHIDRDSNCEKSDALSGRLLEGDPAAVDFEQYELSVLADTLRGYLQDLPCTIIPDAVYSELVYSAQEIQSMEDCGQQLKRILDSPSIPQANHQLLVHLTRHLSKVIQSGGAAQASPRLLALAYSEAIFKHNRISADVNPEHHVKILEALIMVGGLVEIQAAPGTVLTRNPVWNVAKTNRVLRVKRPKRRLSNQIRGLERTVV